MLIVGNKDFFIGIIFVFLISGLVACSSNDGGSNNDSDSEDKSFPAIINFSAEPSHIAPDQSTSIIPIFRNGEGVIDNDIGTVVSGNIITIYPASTTTYTLTVSNRKGDSISQRVTINVIRILNDTGMTECYNNTDITPCPTVDFPGQDAERGLDVDENDDSDGFAGFSFTKLDSNGNPLAETATSWSCVKDNRTNLIWEVKEASTGNLHSSDNIYTWYSTDSSNNSGVPGTMDGGNCSGSLCDTESYVTAVNSMGYCGFNDWRMPERDEFESIVRVSTGLSDPSIDTQYFPHHGTGDYWSGTSPGWSSTVGINGGSANYGSGTGFGFGYLSKSNRMHVRLVRGSKLNYPGNINALYNQTCQIDTVHAHTPNSRFIDNDDGTVIDTQTTLSWTRCPLGKTWDKMSNYCTGVANVYTWQEALREAARLNSSGEINGHTNWRLPNYKEFISISEPQCVVPSINLEIFPIWNTSDNYEFWSSMTNMLRPQLAFSMSYHNAFLFTQNKAQHLQVLLVRDAN